MSVIHVPSEAVVLAMDVHKKSITTGVLEPDATTVVFRNVGHMPFMEDTEAYFLALERALHDIHVRIGRAANTADSTTDQR